MSSLATWRRLHVETLALEALTPRSHHYQEKPAKELLHGSATFVYHKMINWQMTTQR